MGGGRATEARHVYVGHRGGGPGFATSMRVYPVRDLAIVVMSNGRNLPIDGLMDGIASLES